MSYDGYGQGWDFNHNQRLVPKRRKHTAINGLAASIATR